MTKTVCFVNTHYFPFLGGIIQYTKNLAKELQKKGVHVMMITLNVANLAEYEVVDGMEIYRLPCINFMDGRFPVPRLNKKTFHVLKEIKKKHVDLMIINARFYLLSLFMARFSKRNRIDTIIIDHGSSHLTMGSKVMTKLGEWYEHVETFLLKQYCRNFYGVSKASCDWLKHFGIKAKGVLYNAVDMDFIESVLKEPSRDYYQEYELNENAVVVTFTGRLVVEKGIMPLVEAVKKLRKQYPEVCLFVAGDGPLKEEIESSSTDGIFLLGQVELNDIISLLKQSRILCLPSASEGFPTSVLEAVACKCFVAATKVGGATEIIPTKEHGILLEKNDVECITNAIEYSLNNQESIRLASEKSYERMMNNFTWEKTGEKVYQMIS